MMFGVQIQCLQVAFSKKLGQRTIIGDIDLSSILSSLLLYFTHLWLWIQIKHNTMLDLISVLSFLVLFLQNKVILETMSFWRDSKNNTKKKNNRKVKFYHAYAHKYMIVRWPTNGPFFMSHQYLWPCKKLLNNKPCESENMGGGKWSEYLYTKFM